MTKPVIVSIPLASVMEILLDETDLTAAKKKLRDSIIYDLKEQGDVRRNPGRPIDGADHPYMSAEDVIKYKELLFVKERVQDRPEWAPNNQKPLKFSKDQSDMESNQLRLDNGVIAVISLDADWIPPQPLY